MATRKLRRGKKWHPVTVETLREALEKLKPKGSKVMDEVECLKLDCEAGCDRKSS